MCSQSGLQRGDVLAFQKLPPARPFTLVHHLAIELPHSRIYVFLNLSITTHDGHGKIAITEPGHFISYRGCIQILVFRLHPVQGSSLDSGAHLPTLARHKMLSRSYFS